jgi:CP family cyanate transporter-like MFS transporter
MSQLTPNPPLDSPTSTRKPAGLTVATIFLLAICLRPAITGVGPLLERIGTQEHLGEGTQGVLGAIPLLAFASVSPLVHRLARRTSAERAVVGSLLVLGLGLVLRSWSGSVGLWVGTAVVGAAIAVGNVLGPTLVKRDFYGRVSRAMGFYTAFITGAAATASAISVPLANATNWRVALAVWAVPAFVVALLWIPRASAPRSVPSEPATP